MNDPYDYPRCEICKHAKGAACGHPGPVKMTWAYMSWPNTNYDSCCDKYERDAAALRRVHALADRGREAMSDTTISPEEAVRLISAFDWRVPDYELVWLGAVYARPGFEVSVSMEGRFTAPTLRAIADILDRVHPVPAR